MTLLAFGAVVAGFVDSIAGGGGLIMLPLFTLVLGPGAFAVGTNKVGAVVGTAIALLVYTKAGHLKLRPTLVFAFYVGLGALAGSFLSPMIPKEAFRWFLIVSAPIILWIVSKKNLWAAATIGLPTQTAKPWIIALVGLAAGLYDGAWGPGGGTFFFLALVFAVKLPLLGALAGAKLVNMASAFVALSSYTINGYVVWPYGLSAALGMSVGSYFGARYATRDASRLVRPVLFVVVAGLLIKVLFS